MEPWILSSLNENTKKILPSGTSNPQYVDIYDDNAGRINGSWVMSPYVVKSLQSTAGSTWLAPTSMKYKYKLKWRNA